MSIAALTTSMTVFGLQPATVEQSASRYWSRRHVPTVPGVSRQEFGKGSQQGSLLSRESCWGVMSAADLQLGGCGGVVAWLGRGGQDGAVGVPLLQAVPHQLRYLQHPAPGRRHRMSLHVRACCAARLECLEALHGAFRLWTLCPAEGC